MGRSGEVGRPNSADSVKCVESVDTGSASHSVPVVTAALPPAVDPGLPGRGVVERTHIAGFTMNAVLITAQERSFQRITLKSSHRVLPSLLTVMSRWPLGGAGQICSASGPAAGVAGHPSTPLRWRPELSSNQCVPPCE